MTIFPELSPHEGSWVIYTRDGKCVEVWQRDDALLAFTHGLTVKTIGQHLGSLNEPRNIPWTQDGFSSGGGA
jgi:hypothetical protein